MEPIRYAEGRLSVIDQTLLPGVERWIEIGNAETMREAIAALRVRGAPAIGVAAALALAVEAGHAAGVPPAAALERLRRAGAALRSARPTAVNLAWAVDRVLRAAAVAAGRGSAASARDVAVAALGEAVAIWEEDRAASSAMAGHGADYFPTQCRFLTHCNTGGLATGGGGTALGVLLELHRRGRAPRVWVTETRPLLQGARLTTLELQRAGVPVRLLVDGAAAFAVRRERIEAVVVGADRIARNGDVANKVGTLALALAARDAGIPFVVVAPVSTLDPDCPSGGEIPIEERPPSEVTTLSGQATAPDGVAVFNPAFDVTPARLVSAIITERGPWAGPGRR